MDENSIRLVEALDADRNGEWDRAHAIVQDMDGAGAAWVHAYLHRKEGDLANAGYWYRRAGKAPASGSLESEWIAIRASFAGEGA
ncbi:MAG: hypothetical protein KDG54_10635 [Geminicoccaceae bacterium]|nr:hypothetical protein [Geminicoccaceae bacterium]